MSALRNGGPAFPGVTVNDSDVNLVDPFGTLLPPNGQATYSGMTLRDYFAAKVLQGMYASDTEDWGCGDINKRAAAAYLAADAMLKARQA